MPFYQIKKGKIKMIIRTEDGWKGSRLNEYTGDSTCFRKAFKEAGIKGVTVKKPYWERYEFTIRFNNSEIVSKSEYKIPFRCLYSCFIFGKFYKEGIYGYMDEFRKNHPNEESNKEFDRVHKILSDEHYDYYFKNDAEDILNEKGKAKLKKVKEIVSSFNYDRSDTMVDYYDRGFYDFYNCVVV